MNRRNLLYGGAAALAGLAGAGAAWWSHLRQSPQAAAPRPADPFWDLVFETPEGKNLAVSEFRGKPLLVNFWATWCPPCVEELPMLDAFYRQHGPQNFQVLGLAVDQPSAVRKWLQAKPLAFPVGMAGLAGTDLSKALGNTSGGLPFSVLFSAGGLALERKIGKLSPEDLAGWLQRG